jgi:hypothetical protein
VAARPTRTAEHRPSATEADEVLAKDTLALTCLLPIPVAEITYSQICRASARPCAAITST